jgi:hypothetical protein
VRVNYCFPQKDAALQGRQLDESGPLG